VDKENAMYDAMSKVIDATNYMGTEKEMAEGMFHALNDSHRTLQQNFFRIFVKTMKDYGDTNFRDARNNESIDFAKTVGEMDTHFPFV